MADQMYPKSHILIVDDEELVLDFIFEFLNNEGYKCISAQNTKDARRALEHYPIELILCDVNMPEESGIDLIRQVFSDYPETAVIMLTGIDDPEIARNAINLGAYGYILKPFKCDELLINIHNALHRRKLEIQDRLHCSELEKLVSARTAELNAANVQLQKTMEGVIQAMSETIEKKDPYTAGHQCRVAEIAQHIGIKLNLPDEKIKGIWFSSMIHDIGKIVVPGEILCKPGNLSAPEFEIIKTHPQVGHDILKKIEFPWPVAEIILQHHERLDGSGYPRGLTEDEILLETKILSVADVVETMSSHRPYRASLGIRTALNEISTHKGIYYDSDAVEACIQIFEENKAPCVKVINASKTISGLIGTNSKDISCNLKISGF